MTVGLILHGTSLKNLEERIEEFADLNITWATINFYWIYESIIQKIGKRFSMLCVLDPNHLKKYAQQNEAFAKRGLFISREDFPPDYGFIGNTLFCFLDYLHKIGVHEVYLFGADGYSQGQQVYHRQEDYTAIEPIPPFRNDELKKHTELFNTQYQPKEGLKVYNCSPDSNITVFEKLTLDEAISQMRSEEFIHD